VEFDLAFVPSAVDGGCDELVARTRRVEVGDVVTVVADLGDVVRSKEAAGRPKDLQVLPTLYRPLRARDERSGEEG